MYKNVQVVFTGAQGTGKTTMLNVFKDKFENVVTEVVRNLAKNNNVKINEQGNLEGQKTIFNEYLKLLDVDTGYLSDRCMIDVLAYTMYLYEKTKDTQLALLIIEQTKEIEKFFNETHKDVIICYFPIEFEVVDDGVRSTSEEFRSAIDDHIQQILINHVKKHYIICGDTEKRTKTIETILKHKN